MSNPYHKPLKFTKKALKNLKPIISPDIWIDLTIHTNDNQLNNHIWTANPSTVKLY